MVIADGDEPSEGIGAANAGVMAETSRKPDVAKGSENGNDVVDSRHGSLLQASMLGTPKPHHRNDNSYGVL